ncbi:MAG: transcriptional repressor [Actinomycetota bacterium]|nr:transcriptional repressor [Actinomycetota bacterium]
MSNDRSSSGGVQRDLHREVEARLERAGQRYTTARRALVGVLAGDAAPLTLPEVLGRNRALSQSSAYRNLSHLESAGVVRRLVHGIEYARYELAEDLTEHHHHLVCEQCGSVTDVTFDEPVERAIEGALGELLAASGFTARHHEIDVYGACAACAGA